jgi:hypothetical protein
MRRITIGLALVVGVWACEDGTGVDGPDALVGSWISAGGDVAPALRAGPWARDSVFAAFGEDGTLTYVEYDGSVAVDRSGLYEIGQGDGVFPITFLATPPATDTTARGIVRVEGDRLQLEVVEPGAYMPPTVEDGFGSTLDEGVELGPWWIQIFERRE